VSVDAECVFLCSFQWAVLSTVFTAVLRAVCGKGAPVGPVARAHSQPAGAPCVLRAGLSCVVHCWKARTLPGSLPVARSVADCQLQSANGELRALWTGPAGD